uniref:Coiled-coil domain-containing protein 43 n=1 Tax=Rhodnius prolixus TaxID=13249 RepID=T1I9M2_RHOPR
MAACMELDFEQWLKTKLKLLDIDEEVLGHRIYQVLVKEDSLEDKNTCLENLLASFIGSQTKEHTTEIVERWNLHKNQKGNLVVSNDDTWEEPVCELVKEEFSHAT